MQLFLEITLLHFTYYSISTLFKNSNIFIFIMVQTFIQSVIFMYFLYNNKNPSPIIQLYTIRNNATPLFLFISSFRSSVNKAFTQFSLRTFMCMYLSFRTCTLHLHPIFRTTYLSSFLFSSTFFSIHKREIMMRTIFFFCV